MSHNNEQVMRMALTALEVAVIQNAHEMALTGEESRQCSAAIVSLSAALAAQAGQSEPVAWRFKDTETIVKAMPGYVPAGNWTPLYDHPAPVRQPLTEQDIADVMEKVNFTYNPTLFARAIEAKINETKP